MSTRDIRATSVHTPERPAFDEQCSGNPHVNRVSQRQGVGSADKPSGLHEPEKAPAVDTRDNCATMVDTRDSPATVERDGSSPEGLNTPLDTFAPAPDANRTHQAIQPLLELHAKGCTRGVVELR
ncbi:hypothetical protein [Mycolicibacterium conceptionense]|uniref:hypothetical protein n=1 Tax=Mycolicibacterium conceptionense TaxID=451644 RepID=UPI00103D4CAE|nr:hypothetical protein [Mycolicibacterium conceptionense]